MNENEIIMISNRKSERIYLYGQQQVNGKEQISKFDFFFQLES